jgi:hypothetical protein
LAEEEVGEDIAFFLEEETFTERAMDRGEDVDVVEGELLNFLGVVGLTHGVIGGVEDVEGIIDGPERVRGSVGGGGNIGGRRRGRGVVKGEGKGGVMLRLLNLREEVGECMGGGKG